MTLIPINSFIIIFFLKLDDHILFFYLFKASSGNTSITLSWDNQDQPAINHSQSASRYGMT